MLLITVELIELIFPPIVLFHIDLSERQEVFKILTNLGIWQEVRTTQGGMPAWLLKPSFKENLFQGIFEPNQSNEELQAVDPKMIEKLDTYATERWEVCHFLENFGSITEFI